MQRSITTLFNSLCIQVLFHTYYQLLSKQIPEMLLNNGQIWIAFHHIAYVTQPLESMQHKTVS